MEMEMESLPAVASDQIILIHTVVVFRSIDPRMSHRYVRSLAQ